MNIGGDCSYPSDQTGGGQQDREKWMAWRYFLEKPMETWFGKEYRDNRKVQNQDAALIKALRAHSSGNSMRQLPTKGWSPQERCEI